MPLVGVVCLFSPYTAILGVVLILVGIAGAFVPRLFPMSAAGMFHKFRYLHETVTYGVSDQTLWVHTSDLKAEAAWRHVAVWREHNGWLVLSTNGIPAVYLPVESLKAAKVYEEVKHLARQHGREYGSPEVAS